MGLLIYFFHHQLEKGINNLTTRVPLTVIVPMLIIVLGLVSSIISAILAAIILVEIINALPIVQSGKNRDYHYCLFCYRSWCRAHPA